MDSKTLKVSSIDEVVALSRDYFVSFFIVLSVGLSIFTYPRVSEGVSSSGQVEAAEPRYQEVSLLDIIVGSAHAQTNGKQEGSHKKVHSLFERVPLGWNAETVRSLRDGAVALPGKVPASVGYVVQQNGMIGAVGFFLILFVSGMVLYSVIWQKRLVRTIEKESRYLNARFQAAFNLHFRSFIRIILAPVLPVLLLGISLLVKGFVRQEAPLLEYITRLLGLWAVGALILKVSREALLEGLVPFCPLYGRRIFRAVRLIVVSAMIGMAIVWGTESIKLPDDDRAFIQFAVSLAIVLISSSLFWKKEALLLLLPRLPNRGYRTFTWCLDRGYFALVSLTVFMGVLWCLGYRRLSETMLIKTWGVAGAYIAIMLLYQSLCLGFLRWIETRDQLQDETAKAFFASARSILRYGTLAIGTVIILDLLGLLGYLQHILSTPIYTVGKTHLSFWVFLKAGVILFVFVHASNLLQAYLDYKIYPSVGVDTGLAYSINTLVKYLLVAIGCLFALKIIGVDLRILMVFAGGVGIGTGIGLQQIASNVISGFIIIFGRKLRRGDWIKVGDKLGMVSHIYLRATTIWTRENIEYIVPNADLTSKPVINYTLTSPFVRISVPVDVSYNADPVEVKNILLKCAAQQSSLSQFRKPEVRIVRFGDNSLNFELLVWVDIRQVSENDIKSRLYFAMVDALGNAGIEISNTQHVTHAKGILLPSGLVAGSSKDGAPRRVNQ